MTANTKKPLVGPGHVQWNAVGWYVGGLGNSSWMFVISCFLFVNHPIIALVPAIAFATILVVCLLFWAYRDRIYPFTATMILFGILAITTPSVWIFLLAYGTPEVRTAAGWPRSPWPTLFVVVILPAIMIWGVILERIAMNKNDTSKSSYNSEV